MKKLFTILMAVTLLISLCSFTACSPDNTDNNNDGGGKQLTICSHADAVSVGEYDYIDQTVYQEHNCSTCGKCYKAVEKGVVIDSFEEVTNLLAPSAIDYRVIYLKGDLNYVDAENTRILKIPSATDLTIVGEGDKTVIYQLMLGQSGSSNIVNLTIKNIKFTDSTDGFLRIRSKVEGLKIINCNFEGKTNIHCYPQGEYTKSLKDVLIENCTFTNIKESTVNFSAVAVEKCENLTIKNCSFTNIEIGSALQIGANGVSGKLAIENNSFGTVASGMIEIFDASALTESVITGNSFVSQEDKYSTAVNKNQKGLYINVVTGTANMGANKWKEDIDYLEDEYNLNNVIFDLDEQIQLS